jgi:hypothetical protein
MQADLQGEHQPADCGADDGPDPPYSQGPPDAGGADISRVIGRRQRVRGSLSGDIAGAPAAAASRIRPKSVPAKPKKASPTPELNEERTIAPVKLDAAFYLTPKDDELLPERGILGLKPALGLEECGQQVQG